MEDEFDKRPHLKALRDRVAEKYCIDKESPEGKRIRAELDLLECRVKEQKRWFDNPFLYKDPFAKNENDVLPVSCIGQTNEIESDILSFMGDSDQKGEKWLKEACTSATATALKELQAFSRYDADDRDLPSESQARDKLYIQLQQHVGYEIDYNDEKDTHNIERTLQYSLFRLNHNCADHMDNHEDDFLPLKIRDGESRGDVTPKYIFREYYKYAGASATENDNNALLGRWWDVLNRENNIIKYSRSTRGTETIVGNIKLDVSAGSNIEIYREENHYALNTSLLSAQNDFIKVTIENVGVSGHNRLLWLYKNDHITLVTNASLPTEEESTPEALEAATYSSITYTAYNDGWDGHIRRHPSHYRLDEHPLNLSKLKVLLPSAEDGEFNESQPYDENRDIIPIRQVKLTCPDIDGTNTHPYHRHYTAVDKDSPSHLKEESTFFFDHTNFKVPVGSGLTCKEGPSGQRSVLSTPPLRSDALPGREKKLSDKDFKGKIVLNENSDVLELESIQFFSKKKEHTQSCSTPGSLNVTQYCEYGTSSEARWREVSDAERLNPHTGDGCIYKVKNDEGGNSVRPSNEACVFTLPVAGGGLQSPLATFLGISEEELTTCAFDLGDGKKARDYVQFDLCASEYYSEYTDESSQTVPPSEEPANADDFTTARGKYCDGFFLHRPAREGSLSSLTPRSSSSTGSCGCPDDLDSRGSRCGDRSAFCRSGGPKPSCPGQSCNSRS